MEETYNNQAEPRNESRASVAKRPNELERMNDFLSHQEELLNILANRLQHVSHGADTKETDSPNSPHLSAQIDRIGQNNTKIKQILEELAI